MNEVKQVGDGIREAVFGANDGAVSTFGILAGLVGASVPGSYIILTGIVQMIAAGMSMGLGAYISTKSQNEYYGEQERQQKRDIDVHPAREKTRVKNILHERGLEGSTLTAATKSITKNKEVWTHFLVEERFGISDTSYPHPVIAGAIMFFSFVIAGFIAVFPFFFSATSHIGLWWSAILSLLLLFGVGAIKTRFTNKNAAISGFENLLIGAVTGVLGYVTGDLIAALL